MRKNKDIRKINKEYRKKTVTWERWLELGKKDGGVTDLAGGGDDAGLYYAFGRLPKIQVQLAIFKLRNLNRGLHIFSDLLSLVYIRNFELGSPSTVLLNGCATWTIDGAGLKTISSVWKPKSVLSKSWVGKDVRINKF